MSYKILGLNYGGHDTSACISINGKVIAACEQERYDFKKITDLLLGKTIAKSSILFGNLTTNLSAIFSKKDFISYTLIFLYLYKWDTFQYLNNPSVVRY